MSDAVTIRHFVTYSGIRPPARMIEPLTPADLQNRNTYVLARYDDADRLLGFDKMVYGAVEMSHAYEWHPSGRLRRAVIAMDGEATVLDFDEDGRPLG